MINVTKLKENIGALFTEEMNQCNFTIYEYVVLQLPQFNETSPSDLSTDREL